MNPAVLAAARAAARKDGCERDYLLIAFPGGGRILAQRLDSAECVPLDQALGGDADFTEGIEEVLTRLWPECPPSQKRLLVTIGDTMRKAAGIFGGGDGKKKTGGLFGFGKRA